MAAPTRPPRRLGGSEGSLRAPALLARGRKRMSAEASAHPGNTRSTRLRRSVLQQLDEEQRAAIPVLARKRRVRKKA